MKHHAARLHKRRAGDVEAGEGGAFAFAACLERLQLVDGLDPLAVKVGFVPHDPLKGLLRRKQTPAELLVHRILGDGHLEGNLQGTLSVARGFRHVLRDVVEIVRRHLGLVAGDALETPGERGDTLGEIGLGVSFRREAGDRAGAVPLPLLERLQLGDDRSVRAEAVFDSVGAGSSLAALGVRSAPYHWNQSREGYEEKASIGCHYLHLWLLDRLNSFGSLGVWDYMTI